jgi:PAS domain S-box-containing protein
LVEGEVETSRREKRYLRPDGSFVWGQVTSSLVRAADGTPSYFVSQIQDITEQRKQHTRFRALVQNSSDVILVIDAAGIVTYVSPAIEKLLGYRVEELFGRSGFDFIRPEDDPAAREELSRALENEGATLTHERVVLHKDGSEVHIEVALTNLLHDPCVEGIVANVRDITERKLTEMALRAANAVQAELAAILFSSADAIVGSTLGGVISSWNEAAERLFGYEREEIIGKRIGDLIPDHPAYDKRRIIELVKSGKAEFDSRALHKDGSYVEVLVTLSPIKAPDGEITGISGSIRDVGERRALEEQLRQAQKMEAIARLAGGVSHDFNNLLTAILGNCEMLLEEASLPAALREQVVEIKEAAEIGEAISGQLLDISRHRVVRDETLCLERIVTQMGSLLRRLLGEEVELIIQTSGDDVPVVGDAGQLEQVIMNLAVNARDAMPDGGLFTLGLDSVEITPADPLQRSGLEPGPYAVISATDVGVGMSTDVKERIFEPFFTTKTGTLATGLGLSTVYQIVSQMGGCVTVDTAPQMGSTFKVFLPVGQRKATDPVETRMLRTAGVRASVLLVEDDDRVRPVLRRSLEADGYRVIEALDAVDAIKKVDGASEPIDLLVTDIVMPGTRGTALAKELRHRIPGLRVLLMSGHGGDTVRTGPDGEGDAFLEKPFRPRELLESVAAILDGAAEISSRR